MAPVVECRIGEQLVRRPVLDRGPLESEEEKLRLEAGTFLTQLRNEGATGGVGHVGGEVHVRVVEGACRDRLDPLALVDRLGERARRERRNVAVVALAEGRRSRLGLGEIGFDARIVAGGVEIRKVPRNLFGAGLLDGRHEAETR